MRVWNWRTGKCLRILEGHTEGVVCLNFDANILASGSVDTTVKIWNFRTGECFTLRGHNDWVNAVQLWDSNKPLGSPRPFDRDPGAMDGAPNVDSGKMLFSASDDGTIRLWDLSLRTCVQVFKGHVGQVQSLKLLTVDEDDADSHSEDADSDASQDGARHAQGDVAAPAAVPETSAADEAEAPAITLPPGFNPYAYRLAPHTPLTPQAFIHPEPPRREGKWEKGKDRAGTPGAKCQKQVLISGSLDNTIKIWDIETGTAVKTLFGHIEGVWAVASDKLRLVSGSHDRTIKVWVREEGRCMATLVGHRGAVTCLALGEDKIVSGSDDGDVRLWSFGG